MLLINPAFAAQPKRVLVVHSFGSEASPFIIASTAFKSELVAKIGEPIDLDDVSLGMARDADPDMQDAIVDYLLKRRAKWKPDLVVPIGSPAAVFVAKNRERLFADIPVLYTSVDRRLLPDGALDGQAAFIGGTIEIPGLLEDMLKLAPATENIAVVAGASSLEKGWKELFRKIAEPLAPQVKFTYFDDLSFDQMLDRAAKLPPRSYIFFLLLVRDAAGVTYDADDALQRLQAVANAPINAIFEHQLGLGIVGGRLYQIGAMGQEAAHMAIEILRGRPAASFTPRLIERLPPRYDWRELQRWKIDEKLLPPNSTILFRTPTTWERHYRLIIFAVSIFVIQALLISALLFNLFRRRLAEISLRESEERFRTLADAAPVLIWMAGTDKRCTFFNKAWLEFTGRTMEQEIGNGWCEGVHPDDFERCQSTYWSAFDARTPFAMQYRLRRYDGEYRLINDTGVPRIGRQGRFRGYVGSCVDITDLLKQQKALHEFEERVTLAAEAAHLGVWELDTRTDELWVSDKVRELYQLPLDGKIDPAFFVERIHPEDRAMRAAAVKQAFETKGGYAIEYRALLPDGTVRWMHGRARCMPDENGRLTRLVGVSMDVTARKQEQEIFEIAAEASHFGVWRWDEKTKEVVWDKAARQMFGVSPDGPINLDTFYNAIHPEDLDRVRTIWRRAVELHLPYQVEFRIQRPNGDIYWIESRGIGEYDEAERPLRMIGVVFDITERKKAEEEARRQRDEINLLSRVSLLGEMTAALAHELNQPLSAIVSNANAGVRFIDKAKADPATIREILVDVATDGRRATDIIRHVRNTIKRGDVIREAVSLNDVVTSVSHMVRPDAAMHSCELQISLADDLPAVLGDPTQIQQVLINLVGNAFEAMRDVAPNKRKVEITTERNGAETISVAVRDYGVGLPDETRTRIFDQFFTTKEEGLGMGLAIVRSIIEAHGGTIEAENAKGGGARFRFALPISKDAAK